MLHASTRSGTVDVRPPLSKRAALIWATAIALACSCPIFVVYAIWMVTPAGVLLFACGYELLLMCGLGYVGARANSWPITICGVLALIPATFLTQSLCVGFELTTSGFDFLAVLLVRAVIHLFLAASVHGVALALAVRPPGNSGHCRTCDYDLTGNVSGRCPECGGEIGVPV